MHPITTEQNPMTRTWLWICEDCGKNGWGYKNEKEARKAGLAHAAMSKR